VANYNEEREREREKDTSIAMAVGVRFDTSLCPSLAAISANENTCLEHFLNKHSG